jgi:hypothetical protein
MATCSACGRPIPSGEEHLPCPTRGCGSLERAIAAGEEGRGSDQAVQLDQEVAAHPRSWQDQWGRVGRWHDKLRSTAEGRPHEMDSLSYEDEMYAFFESCFHLKDCLKNDPARPLSRPADVEDFVERTEPLRWCADIANGSKHLITSRTPRIDPNTGLGTRRYSLHLGNANPTTISAQYVIVGAGQTRDAVKLAAACLAAWEAFLQTQQLLR